MHALLWIFLCLEPQCYFFSVSIHVVFMPQKTWVYIGLCALHVCRNVMSGEILMAWRKTRVKPWILHWGHYSLALSHRYIEESWVASIECRVCLPRHYLLMTMFMKAYINNVLNRLDRQFVPKSNNILLPKRLWVWTFSDIHLTILRLYTVSVCHTV